jgi:UDP-N-acetylglucosamine--N-acetylmuramyl-(pentapeptide) pyrophosphoryl-undecaprenol N-acetylglucosamine transferase
MNVAIAGGGTGGHLFPGIAIAEEFLTRDHTTGIVFIGTQQGLEARVIPQRGLTLQTIRVRGFKGKGAAQKLVSLSLLPRAVMQSGTLLRRFQADIVCGVGGYISGPVVLAGALLGIHTVIHEQNSFPGLSNRFLGRIVDRVFVSYEESAGFFPSGKTVITGLPLRKQLFSAARQERDDIFTLVVLGGSQGSHEINQSMLAALPYLESIKDRIRIIHQSGSGDVDALVTAYRMFGFDAQVASFIDEMVETYTRAHLIVSRAGAATLAEITCCGKAAVLIPYPHAANNHQEKNARSLVDKGAALMLRSAELSGERLAQTILATAHDRRRLAHMETQARALARPRAVQDIVDSCYRLIAQRR